VKSMINPSTLKNTAIAALVVALLVGCERSELSVPLPAFGGGGGGSSWQGQPPPWAAKPAPKPSVATSPLAPGANTMTDPSLIQDPLPGDFTNHPGIQEVHWVMTPNKCRDLYNRLKQQGENFQDYRFFPSGMPGARQQGHCKLIGPGAIDNRFADHHDS
jgi:hypothetical protein